MTGKKLGIVAFVCAVLFIIFTIIGITQAPEIRQETYEMAVTDMELYYEMFEEDMSKASTLFKVADTAITVTGLAGIVVAIISLVKMSKAKEKGKAFAVLAIVIIIIFFFVYTFGAVDMGAAVQAGIDAGMEMTK